MKSFSLDLHLASIAPKLENEERMREKKYARWSKSKVININLIFYELILMTWQLCLYVFDSANSKKKTTKKSLHRFWSRLIQFTYETIQNRLECRIFIFFFLYFFLRCRNSQFVTADAYLSFQTFYHAFELMEALCFWNVIKNESNIHLAWESFRGKTCMQRNTTTNTSERHSVTSKRESTMGKSSIESKRIVKSFSFFSSSSKLKDKLYILFFNSIHNQVTQSFS